MHYVGFLRLVVHKNAGFVHIVPKTGDTFGNMILVLQTEPLAGLWISKIRERARLRPHVSV